MAEYDLGRAVVTIEIDYAGMRGEMAAAKSMVAADVAKMQRDTKAGTAAMAKDYRDFATSVRNSMMQMDASVSAASASSVRKLEEISRAANRTQAAIDMLASSADGIGRQFEQAWAAAAAASKAGADEQIHEIHRVEEAAAASHVMPGSGVGGGRVGGPSGAPFVGQGGTHTVRLDSAQYTGLIAAIEKGGKGGGGTTIIAPASSGGGGRSSSSNAGLLAALLTGHAGGGLTSRVNIPFMRGFGIPVAGAGIGSAGSFAGLGVEHLLMTLLGLGGSAAGAGIGAGLLGLGSLGKIAVGTGSDVAAFKTAQTNISNTTKAIDNYNTAVATFGKNSTQAQTALKEMNFAIKDLPASLRAQNLAISKANLALEDYWKQASAGAVKNAYTIIQAGQSIAHEYIPLVASAAKANTAIISQGLKPLFAFLKGPDGIGIFNDLEMQFKRDLPVAVHAADQGIEFFLRLIDQASHHTGGLIQWLNHLFTRLNNLSNPQIDFGIMKFIKMFNEWKDLIKALGTDIVLLFRNEAGTAGGILKTLTQMLNRVGDWERTIRGRQQIHTIFQVHKDEVLAIIHALGQLASTFTKIYLTLGPPFTKVFTILLNGALGFIKVLEKIPGGTWLVGLGLLSGKLLGIAKTFNIIRGGLSFLLAGLAKLAGEGGAAKVLTMLATAAAPGGAAKTAEAGVAGGVAAPAEGAAGGGLAGVLARLGGARALGALALPAGGFVAMLELMNLIGGAAKPTNIRNFQARELGVAPSSLGPARFQVTGRAEALLPPTRGPQGPTKDDIARLKDWLHTAENSQKVAGANAKELNHWHDEGNRLAHLFPGMRSEIEKDNAAIDAQRKVVNRVAALMSQHWQDAGIRNLKDLKDAFVTNMTLIQRTVGLHSATGRMLMEKNVDQMISHTLAGMKKGTIGVQTGMKAIERAIDVGMKNGAITADKATTMMVNTLKSLYNKGKINATQFSQDVVAAFKKYTAEGSSVWSHGTDDILHSLANLHAKGKITTQQLMQDVNSIWKSGVASLNKQTNNWYNTQLAYYQRLRKNGTLTQKEYNADIASLETARNSRSKGNIEAWAQNILNGMVQSGKISLSGAKAIAGELNQLLNGLGASPIPVPTSVAVAAYQASHGLASGPGHRGQTGLMMQAGHAGEAGADSIPGVLGDQPFMVAPGEQVVVLTRHHQRELNSMLSPMGGLPGYFNKRKRPHMMATGGYVFPFTSSFHMGRVDMGIDGGMATGAPIGPIGRARVGQQYANWYAGQPLMHWQLLDGPMQGKWVYLAEQITPAARPGQVVAANQAIAHFAGSGTGIEMGWGTSGEATLAQATSGYSEGQQTRAGLDFKAFLTGLAHGKIVGGNLGLGTVKTPQVKGPPGAMHNALQKEMDKGAAAANAYYQKKAAAMGLTGSGSFPIQNVSGPVAREIFQATSPPFNKVGDAGVIGNAWGESSLDPAATDGHGNGGLWGFTAHPVALSDLMNFARSHNKPWTDVGVQSAFLLDHLSPGTIQAVNASGSPSQAADNFMNMFEHPSIKRSSVREAGARAAYAQGYQTGGMLGGGDDFLHRWRRRRSGGGHSGHPRHRHLHGHHGRLTGHIPSGNRHLSGHGHLHRKQLSHAQEVARMKRLFPHAWHWIRHLSPYFPPEDLGEHYLGQLEHTSRWEPIKHLTNKQLQGWFKYLHKVQSQEIPRLQEHASSLGDISGLRGNSWKRQHTILNDDRHAAMLAIQAAHAVERVMGVVKRMNHGKKTKPFPRAMSRLISDKHNLLGLSGQGGLVHDTELTLMSMLHDMTGTGSNSGHAQRLLALERQREALLRQRLAVEKAQYKVLAHRPTPAYGGMYHNGGTIPGPPGMPVVMQAEAGEHITKRGQSPAVKLIIEKRDGTDKLIDARIERYGRRMGRRANYTLPSRGGY